MPPPNKPDHSQGLGAYDQLLADIRGGVLKPGDRLTETDLADRFGISRTPIREAVRKLEADGLVEHVPRVGATIRQLQYAEVMELYDMRAVLEATAARMAARAASDIELDELAAINDDLANSGLDAQRAYDLNRQFHLTLLDAAKNRFLTKSMATLQKTLLILGPSTMTEPSRRQNAPAEHAEVIAALRRRDAEAAETAMRAHIEAAHKARLRQLRHNRQLLRDAPGPTAD